MTITNFDKKNINRSEAIQILEGWESGFSKRRSKPSSTLKNSRIDTARSIASQSIASLKNGDKHAYIWGAFQKDTPCALLIGDDFRDGIKLRFLIANVQDSSSKGAGSFLVSHMVVLANKISQVIRVIPENSEKYWKNQPSFKIDPSDPTQYISTTNSPKAAPAGKTKKFHKNKAVKK